MSHCCADFLHTISRINGCLSLIFPLLIIHVYLNHASRYAQHMVAIKAGTVVREGSPAEVMKKKVLREVFSIEADIVPDPRTGVPLCFPFE